MPIKPIPQTIVTGSDPSANLLLNRDGNTATSRTLSSGGTVTANVVNVTNVNTTVTRVNNPGGADGDVQFNVGGRSFGGEDAFNYDSATDTLTIAGTVVAGNFKYTNGASVGGGSGGNAAYAVTAGFASQAATANVAIAAYSVSGANVTGSVSSAVMANLAMSALSTAGANVVGSVSQADNAAVADVARSVAGANVTGSVGQADNAAVADVARSVSGANIVMPLVNVTVSGTTNLGSADNLRITGGSAGQVLTTNGSGDLTWTTPDSDTTSLPASNILVVPSGNISSTTVQGALVELDSDVATLTTGLNGKVAKAGDTMTGGLVINNANLAAPSLRVRNGNVVFADQFTGNAFVFDIAAKTATITGSGGIATLTGSEIYANRYAGNVLLGSTGMGGGKVRLRDGDGNPSEPVEDDNAITKRYLDNRLANVSVGNVDLTGYVQKAGDTMTGTLILDGEQTEDNHAATIGYVDDAVAAVGDVSTPPYRGFKAHYGRMFIDEPTISKLVIYRDTASAPTSIIDTNTSDDLFEVSGLGGSDFVALLNIYGTSESTPLDLPSLMTFFEAVIDNVILDGEGEINPIAVIKTNFYDNFAALSAVAGDLYSNFQFGPSFFPNLTTVVALPNEAASGFLVNLRRAGNGAAEADGYNNPGANYMVGDTVTVDGTQFPGGTSPANDIILTITQVGGSGEVLGYTVASGTIPAAWPTNSIDDGGDDQYDTGNYISTNLAADIAYNNGDVVADSAAQFGAGSSYVVTYNDSIFGIFATNVTITSIKTDGNSGFDGDGTADTGSLFGATQTVAQLINGAQAFILNSDGSVKMSNGPLLSGNGDTGLKFGFSTAGYAEDNKYFQVRPGGDNYDHIHLDTGSNGNFDLFLGDDIRYVKNARDGNVYISTNHDTGVTWTFDQNGNLTLPSNSANINHANGTSILNNVVTRESGSWTLVDGENNVSITVPGPGTYSMWVNGNIPNGIVVWNATVTVTNTNVPAIGSQYAWYYEPEGGPVGQLVLTAIPTQIVGTSNTISTDTTYVGTTSSEFEFTITNNSGSNQVVEWGYIKL
jgi:hypothetical protein